MSRMTGMEVKKLLKSHGIDTKLVTVNNRGGSLRVRLKEVKYMVNYALRRMMTGGRYGDDMKSSAALCYEDAIKLLTTANDLLENEIKESYK